MIVREMTVSDIKEISKIEKTLYKDPWNDKQFEYDLKENEFAYLFVLENEGVIIGYYGFWVMFDNVDLTKVSIRKEFQGFGLGKLLLEDCFKRVKMLGCKNINLEVRESNEKALNLYKKYGFKYVTIRKDYYSKGENAIVLVKECENHE